MKQHLTYKILGYFSHIRYIVIFNILLERLVDERYVFHALLKGLKVTVAYEHFYFYVGTVRKQPPTIITDDVG